MLPKLHHKFTSKWHLLLVHLFSERVVRVRRHACGHMEHHLNCGGGKVGHGQTRALVPLQAAHETTMTC